MSDDLALPHGADISTSLCGVVFKVTRCGTIFFRSSMVRTACKLEITNCRYSPGAPLTVKPPELSVYAEINPCLKLHLVASTGASKNAIRALPLG
jgi:hypothetical protein